MKLVRQSPKDQNWIDEAGNNIPYKSIKEVEKVNEKITFDIAKKAIQVSESLTQLRLFIEVCVEKAVSAFHKDYKGKRTKFKGNYTIFNFNQTVKVEVNVSNPVKFDDFLIGEAKRILTEFLNDGIHSKHHAIKQMVIDAFETTRGKMDVKKIMGLKRYADRIDDHRYAKAMKLIDQAQRRPDSATYYRAFYKEISTNKWITIPLALSDV